MIVAEELGVTVDDIHVVTGDTALTPVDLGSFASRVTLMAGNAALEGARKLKQILLETAAEIFKVPVESFVAANGLILGIMLATRRAHGLVEAADGPAAGV